MSYASSRRVPPPQVPSTYSAVPTTSPRRSGSANSRKPYSPPPGSSRAGARTPSAFSSASHYPSRYQSPPPAPVPTPTPAPVPSEYRSYYAQDETAHGVQTGAIGGGYGPYSYQPSERDERMYRASQFNASSVSTVTAAHEKNVAPTTAAVPPYLWDTKDPDLDDPLHNPDPVRDAALDRSFTIFSSRGWSNFAILVLLVVGLVALFAGYPIFAHYSKHPISIPGFNLGGTNGTGQVPFLQHFPSQIDRDTPDSAKTKIGTDGLDYNLVFSDEFNVDGRSFYPGDDPFWEAVDLHYWPTGDIEWYDPSAITTRDGKLVITLSQKRNHDLNFMSGMLQSWNKWCFTTGIIEVSLSLPGDGVTPGLWPAVWTLGNLGRAGYGATNEGMWPYSYAACDVGTFPNQTDHNGTPAAAATGGEGDGPLSFLPGQRLSACTCPGSDHPGPNVATGRGTPEIDIIEAQIDLVRRRGESSQSFQIAPYDYKYEFNDAEPATTVMQSETTLNTYKGGVFQQAVSAVTLLDNADYGGNGYASYGFEWWSNSRHRDEGYIAWLYNGAPTWRITADSLRANPTSQVSQRIISEEPHSIIMNLGMAPSFQPQDFKNLRFPVSMYVDWVRVYQRAGSENVGCDPKDRPTADYIERHINAYTNPNMTTWAQAGNTFPRNSLYDGC